MVVTHRRAAAPLQTPINRHPNHRPTAAPTAPPSRLPQDVAGWLSSQALSARNTADVVVVLNEMYSAFEKLLLKHQVFRCAVGCVVLFCSWICDECCVHHWDHGVPAGHPTKLPPRRVSRR